MNHIDVVFFDLFFTLIIPKYDEIKNENDVLGMTPKEWEIYSEDSQLYFKRASGKVEGADEIIEDIVNKIPFSVNKSQKEEIRCLRENRMKKALTDVDSKIIEVLCALSGMGKRMCLISNADLIDVMHWKHSILADYFEDAAFSYEVGCLKPSPEIYQIAIERMQVKPANCFYVGDGGSDELRGAKELGMKTAFTEYLDKKSENRREIILQYADYHITEFMKIADLLY